MGGTLVLNASMEILNTVSWQKAVTMIVSGEAEVHEADENRMIRSQHLSIPFPRVIRLVRYVYVRFLETVSPHARLTKKGVLNRDGHICGYCGKKNATTVDHILPQSRGGKDTWENLIAACKPCNNVKADRTPDEAGMPLLWEPYAPDRNGYEQRQVWKSLKRLETEVPVI